MAIDETKEEALTGPGVYERPPVDPTYKEQRTPGPIAQGLSKALMQSAFTKFGQAFTDTGDVRRDAATRESRLAPYAMAGGEAASALEARWHTMEYENFKAEHIDPWVQMKKSMLDDYQRRHAQADLGIFEGPDGEPDQVPIHTAEGRLKAVRMRGALEKRFYALNSDMDLELFNEAGKYEGNPQIIGRAQAIQAATANQLMTITNPEQTLDAADKMSVMRAREAEAAAQMVKAKATRDEAASRKRPVSYREAINHPDIGVPGIMQWFTSDPAGLAMMHAPGGGNSFVVAEAKIARGKIMKDNPDLKIGDPRIDAKLDKREPLIMMKAAGKYLKQLDPAAYAAAQEATPHFFVLKQDQAERGIVSDRQDPKVRQQNVDKWKEYAQDHFNKYMENPANDSSIDAAMDDLEQWLGAAVYGDTDELELQAITAARGQGTTRYVGEILDQIPDHIKNWWATKGGSGIAQEENPEAAARARLLSGKSGTRRARQAARVAERERKKKEKGLLP